MGKTTAIELPTGDRFEILYEDRSILAIDKPAGWMLVPVSWQRTGRNLQAALLSSIAGRDFWARSRNLKFLRYVHRLDAETTGVLLLAKSIGALKSFERLFESRQMEKRYLVVTDREPRRKEWTCRFSIAPDPAEIGRMRVHKEGKPAETVFQWLASAAGRHLIEARPYTGRTHQIRLHMKHSGCPVLGDPMYGDGKGEQMGLRAVELAYRDPFSRRFVRIEASAEKFLREFGFRANPSDPRRKSRGEP